MPSPRFNHGFKHDLFLSYCHKDDEPDVTERRWVSKFEKDLKTQLEQDSGRTVQFWRDSKLGAADRFNDEIFAQLRNSAVLVPIITRNYFNSEFCQHEWRQFYEIAPPIENTTRIVKVAKTHVPPENYPFEFRETNEHSLFVQESNGQYRQYHLHPDPLYEREYAAHVDDVAQELEHVLGRLEGGNSNHSSKGVVYVAETSSDLNPERDRICRNLNQLRYEVRPKNRLFGMAGPEVRQVVQRDLADSRLAIFPIGAYYGTIPEQADEASIVRIQIEVAASDRRNGDFPRLVWVPKGVRPAEPRQLELLKQIRESWARNPFEVLELVSHQFEEVMEERLRPSRVPTCSSSQALAADSPPERPSVYVIAEPQDVQAADAVRQLLFEDGFDVPALPEDFTQPIGLREERRRHFVEDHAFLIFYGNTNEDWVRAQIRELTKATGLDRKTRILTRAVFLADPKSEPKKKLLLRGHYHELTRFPPIFDGTTKTNRR